MIDPTDFGWEADRPCPPWCESTDHHLGERLLKRTDDFWHRGPTTWIPTEDVTPNLEPIAAEVYLSQHVVVDERGYNTRPAEVVVEYAGTFSPENARKLAAALANLAAEAGSQSNHFSAHTKG